MTATSTEVDLETISFTLPPCEHTQHEEFHPDEPGSLMISAGCTHCPDVIQYIICEGGFMMQYESDAIECGACGGISAGWDIYKILYRL